MAAYDFAVEQIISVHDGDTCCIRISQGFGASYTIDVRLDGIDTPELMKESKIAATVARDVLTKWLAANMPKLRLFSKTWDKYGGRALGSIYIDGDVTHSASAFMLAQKLAKPYDGSKKIPWTAEELAAVAAYKV